MTVKPTELAVVRPVILCGGSGTRLWPLSRKSFPKQFVPLVGDKSLLQLTLERVSHLGGGTKTLAICVASEDHRFLVGEAMQAANVSGSILLEPVPRNTAPAMRNAANDQQFVRPDATAFSACRAESIDHAVLEHHGKVAVVPFAGAWSDIGSWNAVAELNAPNAQGNHIHGQGFALHSNNTFVHAPQRPVVVVGAQDLLVIDTPDALLVAASSHVEQVKQVVARLDADNVSQSVQHRKVARPWGAYDSVDVGERHQVKRITVRPGAKLCLQMHHQRAEPWIVVKDTALVTRGEEEILLTENQSTYIPLGVKHRLDNPGKTELELSEVQSGSYLGEDDIVRFEDTYGRLV